MLSGMIASYRRALVLLAMAAATAAEPLASTDEQAAPTAAPRAAVESQTAAAEKPSGPLESPAQAPAAAAGEPAGAAEEPAAAAAKPASPTGIDRRALVSRHDPVVRGVDPWSPLSVGNGHFAFTMDATGLQTFASHYHARGIPTETQARWAWRSSPNPEGYRLEDANEDYTVDGRTVPFPTNARGAAGDWLRRNPSSFPLATLRLLAGSGYGLLEPENVRDTEQTLELWTGVVRSRYTIGGKAVEVTTVAHPRLDLVAFRIESELVGEGGIGVELAFARGYDPARKNTPAVDWGAPDSHTTRILRRMPRQIRIERQLDDARYRVGVAWMTPVRFGQAAPHVFHLRPARPGQKRLELAVAFSRGMLPPQLPGFEATLAASSARWQRFWQGGAALDLSGSRDPRAAELERRVVLSQYLLALQMGGDTPPQETGLTASSWYGKHHTEMVFWHVAHSALWGRDEPVANALSWYLRTLPAAREIAAARGLRGARWPKMVGPEGRESPGGNPLIVWNQPHVIALAELLYRGQPSKELLERYRELVLETADCMVSMLRWEQKRNRYVLGPPLWIAQEIYDPRQSVNPAFELSYWRYALGVAQRWRERLGLGRSPEWRRAIQRLSALPQRGGRYVAIESLPDTFDKRESRQDHPTMLAPFGLLPGEGVDKATMRRTLAEVLASWDFEAKIWGWDYPLIAMTAARLGDPERAVEVLLREAPNNGYRLNGHCPQRGDLAVYLPANGALLTAVAMMAGGWDGAPKRPAPGFPREGWTVRAEGFRRLP